MRLGLSYGFLCSKVTHVGWRDIDFGMTREYVDAQCAVDFARARVAETEAPQPDTQLLAAGRLPTRIVKELVEQLAGASPPVDDAGLRDKWLYLVLAWVYENREAYPDPLHCVEEVYADFDYPDCISKLVRYTPPEAGAAVGADALMERWKDYVECAGRRHRPPV